MDLDETAFRSREKAITVHEKNMELVHAGVFNEWTRARVQQADRADAGPYAKHEVSTFLGPMAADPTVLVPGRSGSRL
jgi:hypothetical protein